MDVQMVFSQRELLEYKKKQIEELKALYIAQLNQLDAVTQGNKAAVMKADNNAKRRHFYYCLLTSLINSPMKAAFENINRLICIRKLLLNRQLRLSNELATSERYCCEQNCPQMAICGSNYCGWHIVKDTPQVAYIKCQYCGWPTLSSNLVPCRGHRENKTRVKKHSKQ